MHGKGRQDGETQTIISADSTSYGNHNMVTKQQNL